MDFDSFLTSPRWEILKIIAEKPSSPVEIAEKLNTTVAYVSQQLKLLDAANLLNKEKTGAALKGKPRTLFSISREFIYLTVLINSVPWKKLIYLTPSHKVILKIWEVHDPELHYPLQKIYWSVEEDINETNGIFIENNTVPKFIILTESKKIKLKIENLLLHLDKKIDCHFISKGQLKKFSKELLISLYDPHKFLEELKGGKLEKDE